MSSSEGGAAASSVKFSLRKTARLPVDKETAFVSSQWEDKLSHIPNIGPETSKLLTNAGITSAYGLAGKFLMLKTPGDNSQTRCDAFCAWLDSIGVTRGNQSVITFAIAKKLNRACARARPRRRFLSLSSPPHPAPPHYTNLKTIY